MKEAAWVAKIIRNELKAKFPGVKFSVTSDNFAGGDAVRVRYDKGSKAPAAKEVEAVADKFQAGYFDGSTDCYEYTYRGDGPTVKYVTVSADYPVTVSKAVHDRLGWRASPEQYQLELESELVAQGF